MYADDSLATLTYSSKEEGLRKIKDVSETIEDWAKAVGLSVNKQKSEFMCLSTSKKNAIDEATILGEKITSKNSIKLVGVTMDRKFNFNEQTEILAQKIRGKVYKMKKSAFGHNLENKRILYLGYVQGTLLAGAEGWLPYTSKKNITKLRSAMRSGLRYVVGAKPYGNQWYDGSPFSATNEELKLGIKSVDIFQNELLQQNAFRYKDFLEQNEHLKNSFDDKEARCLNDVILKEFKGVEDMTQLKKIQRANFQELVTKNGYKHRRRMKRLKNQASSNQHGLGIT